MKIFLYILAIAQFAVICVSCTKYDQQLEITDLNKSQVIILHKKTYQKEVYSMGNHCHGKLDGEARLVLILNGAPYKTEMMKGKVNFKWGGDWYADSMELRYEPLNIKSGKLKIEYTFNAL